MRKIQLKNKYYYHIHNRGADKREIFCNEKDYSRFLRAMREFNQSETVGSLYRQARQEAKLLRFAKANRSSLASFIAYCLNPNHYHLLFKKLCKTYVHLS